MISSTGSTPNNYLFAGEQYDAALGLYYNRARYLNTTTGRFWSMDTYEGTVRDPLSLHKYLYVAGDPANRIANIGGEGHWSVPVTQETALPYEEKFAEAAQRIRNQDPNRFPRNPNY